MRNNKRSRPRANPGAAPDPAPADPDAPINVRRLKDGGWFYVWNEAMDYLALPFTVTTETKQKRVVDGRTAYVKTGQTKTEEHTLGAHGLAVYCALCFHGDNSDPSDRDCHPSLGGIAKRLGLSFNTVKTKVAGLEKLGLVEIIREVGQAHEYRIVPLAKKAKKPSQPVTRLSGPNGKEPSQPVTRLSPEPSHSVTTPPSQPVTTNKNDPNKNTTKTPKPAENQAQGGGGDAGKNAPELAAAVMRELEKYEVANAAHTKRLAAEIAKHAPSLAVALAVIDANGESIKAAKPRNMGGVLYDRLKAMTADDWKAKTIKPAVTYRVIEAEE